MKKHFIPFFVVMGLALSFSGCSKDEPSTVKENLNIVRQFVYDGMSLYYLWAPSMLDKIPPRLNIDPVDYFESLLYPIDRERGWSWITDDVEELLADFEGESNNAFGFSPTLLWTDETKTNLIAVIKYVYPDTPAYEAGLKRGDIIIHINGEPITSSNYLTLFGSNAPVTFKVFDQFYKNPHDISITPRKINTDPVLYTHVYHYPEQGKKIAYLFYAEFISNYNKSLFNAFSKFNREGVTDLIVDLRYNPGGDISAATYLGSLIAPRTEVENKSVFTILSYNPWINAFFDEEGISRSDSLGVYREEVESNPLDANLNLNNVYILATNFTYSASELTTFCLNLI
ncbi:S41 family peptidase [Anaerorudis cellulosivorans]|uniref:S41 family peptidase n=1 Tax=Anaerorudis cellulosivorans TaxID=3397862 RepID=UPI00222012BD|nr:S41 family peptidase [Seramator thermalis]MCW1735000.1 S41 family peptidase [Seramator thermalis]